jgi:hypothetical protein
MIAWLRANLHWDFAFGIVGIVAGVVGATFIAIEHFIPAEVCFGLSGLTLVLWSIARKGHWMLRYLLLLIISGCFIFLIHWIDEFRIKKESEAFEQNVQFQLSQRTQSDLQDIKKLLESSSQNTPPPALDKFIESRRLEQKYPRGFALFYSDGRKILYYDRPNNNLQSVSVDPSKVGIDSFTDTKICLSMSIFSAKTGLMNFSNSCFGRNTKGESVIFHYQGGVEIVAESLANSTDGAAWVIGVRQGS